MPVKPALGLLIMLFLAACRTTLENSKPAPVSSPTIRQTLAPESTPVEPVVPSPMPSPIPTEAVHLDLDAIPPVDTSQFAVPLSEIYFDTFRPGNRAVPLSEANEVLIRSLLDVIPPIYQPVFESAAAGGEWLRNHDLILGYADGTQAFAYPIRILNFHEIVSQTVNGRPILISYCPLCRSGIVYDRRLDGETLLFGNTSALYESDMVMVDHQTGSYWMQVSGEAIVGTLTGARLTPLPSQTTTWAQWLAQYPDTLVLSQDTGYNRDYRVDPFAGYGRQLNETGRFVFPVSENGRDPRLNPAEVVLGVAVGNGMRAYPIEQMGDGVINDMSGGMPLVVFSLAEGPTGAAYVAEVDGRTLTFFWRDGRFTDNETGSIWNFTGQAIAGQLAGTQLQPLPVRSTFWFSLIAAFPDLTLVASD